MNSLFISRLLISLACLLLASCATLQAPVKTEPAAAEPESWAQQQQQRRQINTWEIRGRLGLQTRHNGGSMDIIWKQLDEEYSIRLIAPLAAGNYLIQGDRSYAEVRMPDGEIKIIDNSDDIFSAALGIDLPVTAIKDWLRGLPAAALSIESLRWNEQGLLHRLQQAGWNIEMTNYNGSRILLPHNIYVTHDDRPELDIRLALRQWLLD